MDKVFSNGKTEANIQESIKKGKSMEEENMKKQMETHSKDISKMMFFKEMEFIHIQMEIHMSVITKMDTEEVKESLLGQTGISMTDNGKEILWKAKER